MDQSKKTAFVFFDLETSGLDEANAEILQIGLSYEEDCFGVYITPTKYISPNATAINGLTFYNGELYRHGQRVSSLQAAVALDHIRTFLESIKNPVVLVAHNAKFDSPRFIRMLQNLQLLAEFKDVLLGFVDTLPVFREVRREYTGNKLVELAEAANIDYEGAHDAITDACILQKLISHHNISNEQLLKKFFTVDECERDIDMRIQTNKNKDTLEPVFKRVLSKGMIQKIASEHINLNILVDTFKEKGQLGVESLFSEDVNGKPRITKQKRIIENVAICLKKFCFQESVSTD